MRNGIFPLGDLRAVNFARNFKFIILTNGGGWFNWPPGGWLVGKEKLRTETSAKMRCFLVDGN